jgi:hypothetical protein
LSDDFLDDFVDESSSALDEVMKYVDTLDTLASDIEKISEQLKEKQSLFDELSKETLPALLAQNGLDELKLSNGKKLSIKEDVFVGIPKNDEGKKLALEWLGENGGTDLIKEEVTVDNPTPELKNELRISGMTFEENTSVNTNSLKAWFKRRLGMTKGSIQDLDLNEVPKAMNLFIERKAVIK